MISWSSVWSRDHDLVIKWLISWSWSRDQVVDLVINAVIDQCVSHVIISANQLYKIGNPTWHHPLVLRGNDIDETYDHSRVSHLTTWPLDHMTTWPHDHLTTWPLDHMTTWLLDHMTTWPHDHLTTWPLDHNHATRPLDHTHTTTWP